ncbi:MAG: autotransporter outer membrane beta-barrel domain-containing protein [Planctomycetaceae bacterium]|jgi:uncharacterized protein with beta-barrel porin domain|nr:autotransporter outer membrane beta-barrel domain-containing protein [Planctomycetaceae bacterium]
MSETAKSRMFRLAAKFHAAMQQWATSWREGCCALAILIALGSVMCGGTAEAQEKTRNERIMGDYLEPYVGNNIDKIKESMFPPQGGDFRDALTALYNAHVSHREGSPLYHALDQMSGSIYGTVPTASFQNMVMLHNTLANYTRRDQNSLRLQAREGLPEERFVSNVPQDDYWGMIHGNSGTMQSDGNDGKYRQTLVGFMGGMNAINNKTYRLGWFFSAGFGELKGNVGDKTGSMELDFGPYFRKDTRNTYLLVQAGLGFHCYDTKRRLVFGNPDKSDSNWTSNWCLDRTAKGNFDAWLGTVHLETGLKYRGGPLNLSPFVGVQFTGLSRDKFKESGAGCLNLVSSHQGYNSFRTMFGMRLDSQAFRLYKGAASMYGNAAWLYEFEQICTRPNEFTARFSGADPDKSPKKFTVYGNDPGRDWFQAGFGVNYDIYPHLRASLGYDAYLNTNQVMHSLNLGLVRQW